MAISNSYVKLPEGSPYLWDLGESSLDDLDGCAWFLPQKNQQMGSTLGSHPHLKGPGFPHPMGLLGNIPWLTWLENPIVFGFFRSEKNLHLLREVTSHGWWHRRLAKLFLIWKSAQIESWSLTWGYSTNESLGLQVASMVGFYSQIFGNDNKRETYPPRVASRPDFPGQAAPFDDHLLLPCAGGQNTFRENW